MSKKLWIALVVAMVAAVAGLQPGKQQTSVTHSSSVQHSGVAHDNISELTAERRVVGYLQQHQRLPDYYITKSQARRQGWDAREGNLCNSLPGRAIGGDRFANREERLPQQQGRKWFEADVNYRCGHRNADRLLYSSDGLIFLTKDHYRSFNKVN